jgi:hypothetical protein
MGEAANLAATAHAFNKILSHPKLSSKSRTSDDVEENVKKLRRLILIEGIPSKAVRNLAFSPSPTVCLHYVGLYAATQDLENPAQGHRPACENIPRIRGQGPMRSEGKDPQRHLPVRLY